MQARLGSIRLGWHALVATRALTECCQNAWLAMRVFMKRKHIAEFGGLLGDLRKELNSTVKWDVFRVRVAKGLLAQGAAEVAVKPGSAPVSTPEERRGPPPRTAVTRVQVEQWQFEAAHVGSHDGATVRQRRARLEYYNKGAGLKLR